MKSLYSICVKDFYLELTGKTNTNYYTQLYNKFVGDIFSYFEGLYINPVEWQGELHDAFQDVCLYVLNNPSKCKENENLVFDWIKNRIKKDLEHRKTKKKLSLIAYTENYSKYEYIETEVKKEDESNIWLGKFIHILEGNIKLLSKREKKAINIAFFKKGNREVEFRSNKDFYSAKSTALKKLKKFFNKKDKVNFSVFTKEECERGKNLIVQVFGFLEKEAGDIFKNAKSLEPRAVKKSGKDLQVNIKRGEKIELNLLMKDCGIEKSTYFFYWKEITLHAVFDVSIPKKFKKEKLIGEVRIYIEDKYIISMFFAVMLTAKVELPVNYIFVNIEEEKNQYPLIPTFPIKFNENCGSIKLLYDRIICFFERDRIDLFFQYALNILRDNNDKEFYWKFVELKKDWKRNHDMFLKGLISPKEYKSDCRNFSNSALPFIKELKKYC